VTYLKVLSHSLLRGTEDHDVPELEKSVFGLRDQTVTSEMRSA